MNPDSKNQFSLDHIDRLVTQIESALGLQKVDVSQTAENLYLIAREMYFSIPSEEIDPSLTEEQKNEIFETEFLKMSRSTFLKRTQARIKSIARHNSRNKTLKKLGSR